MRPELPKSVNSRGFRAWLAPLAIGLAAAVAELAGDRGRLALRYARDGLEGGQLWRLVTGHIVHLGPSHMLMNIAALGVLAWLFVPLLRTRDWLVAGLAAALAIDAGLYRFGPEVQWYVGLSGVLHGFWACACIRALLLRQREALPLALLLVAKLTYELVVGPVPLTGAVAAGPVVTVAHAWGALGGGSAALLLFAIIPRVFRPNG